MDEVTIGDKTYISSKRAAEITGYAKDYVGQLCREGHVDAKMVGRGWYVYEPSIRRHRFGDPREEVHEAAPEPIAAPQPAAAAWEPPVYKAETPAYIPELEAPVVVPELEAAEMAIPARVTYPEEDATLTDMQAAWREWFDKKRVEQFETPEIESPEVIDARNEAQEVRIEAPVATYEAPEAPQEEYVAEEEAEVTIPLHRIEEAPVAVDEIEQAYEEEIVPIHRVAAAQPEQAPVRHEARIVREQIIRKGTRRAKNRSYTPIVALLVALSMLSVAIAVLGSGIAGNYVDSLAGKNAITQYLVGERVLNK